MTQPSEPKSDFRAVAERIARDIDKLVGAITPNAAWMKYMDLITEALEETAKRERKLGLIEGLREAGNEFCHEIWHEAIQKEIYEEADRLEKEMADEQ